jgi:hypothetical protein
MNGEFTLYTTLKDDSTFYNMLSSWGASKALVVGIVEPIEWTIEDTTASIYTAVPVDKTSDYLSNDITVNCRAPTEGETKELASALIDALNIVPFDGGRFYCITNGIIAPEDENDSYNMPVTVTVKAVKELD